jgi:hypothetical protein
MGHYSACTDQRFFADCHAAHDHGAAADGRALFDYGWNDSPIALCLQLAISRSSWVAVVDKHNSVPNEYFVLDSDTLANESVRRYFATNAHCGVLLNLNEGPDPAVIADTATIQIDKIIDGDVTAEFDVRRNSLKSRRLTHIYFFLVLCALRASAVSCPEYLAQSRKGRQVRNRRARWFTELTGSLPLVSVSPLNMTAISWPDEFIIATSNQSFP